MEKQLQKYIKNRHDTIDNLKLRMREKRVLYLLLVVLAFTVSYGFRESFIQSFAYQTPEVRKQRPVRRTSQLTKEDFLAVEHLIEQIAYDYPNYAIALDELKLKTQHAHKLFHNEEKINDSQSKLADILQAILYFANHPQTVPGKTLDDAVGQVDYLMKLTGVAPVYDYRIQKIIFDTNRSTMSSQAARNPFRFYGGSFKR